MQTKLYVGLDLHLSACPAQAGSNNTPVCVQHAQADMSVLWTARNEEC